jgi:glycosyltransferase involved in cell wall biosynthesis
MKIAQVAPLTESVPPKFYGGTERVVSHLVEELVRRRHEVTLFASGDSRTSARLVPVTDGALRLSGCQDAIAPHVLMLEHVMRRASDFDIIHFHVAPLHFPLARRSVTPHVTTLHGRLDLSELAPLFREYQDIPCVSISDAQRAPLPQANWVATVKHGLPSHLLSFEPGPGSYLAFLGRISPEKRVDRAIAIARAARQPLRIAAKVDPADSRYFEREIRPLLDDPLVDFIGEIDDHRKREFLSQARALLFPIDWPEPFGLVMIEALACGTPVVAFRGGSVDEVLDDGLTGFIVETVEEAVAAVGRVDAIDRRTCRAVFEQRFSVGRMAEQYLEVYQRLITNQHAIAGLSEPPCSPSYA